MKLPLLFIFSTLSLASSQKNDKQESFMRTNCLREDNNTNLTCLMKDTPTVSLLERRESMDGCFVQNLLGLPTCNPTACNERKEIVCSKSYGKCKGQGFDLPWLENICKGCQCKLPPEHKKRIDALGYRKRTEQRKAKMLEHSEMLRIQAAKMTPIGPVSPSLPKAPECRISNPFGSHKCNPTKCAEAPGVVCERRIVSFWK